MVLQVQLTPMQGGVLIQVHRSGGCWPAIHGIVHVEVRDGAVRLDAAGVKILIIHAGQDLVLDGTRS